MRVVVGTYRGRTYLPDTLRSLDRHVTGVDDLIFIDDSGEPDHAAWLSQYGKVIEVGRRGYGEAMKAACRAAEGREAFWLEEDFTFTEPVSLPAMSEILYHRPYLAQVALLRGPHFPVEHRYGGVIEALVAQGHQFVDVLGVLEHTATFTGNPSVWRAEVLAAGWPDGQWSEERKRDVLVRQGYRFGYLPGIKVCHSGERTGFGY
ncbi:hypothetical protein MAUB1S_02905 [Mycolicibacterium aubagnense]